MGGHIREMGQHKFRPIFNGKKTSGSGVQLELINILTKLDPRSASVGQIAGLG